MALSSVRGVEGSLHPWAGGRVWGWLRLEWAQGQPPNLKLLFCL